MKAVTIILSLTLSPLARADCLSEAQTELLRCRRGCGVDETCRVECNAAYYHAKRACAHGSYSDGLFQPARDSGGECNADGDTGCE